MSDSSSTELADLLRRIGWSAGELQRRLNVSDSTTRSWLTGRRSPPEAVLRWLRQILEHQAQAPPYPEGWNRDGGDGDC